MYHPYLNSMFGNVSLAISAIANYQILAKSHIGWCITIIRICEIQLLT